ncbi:hypothetical protein AB833_10025 [Chromatiales bacterium (ex Bugula neritina AB1)]|nr:hypothetical protein AB833_10025 [Chromatiales bacterium (ex Bugula neritina AB1)]
MVSVSQRASSGSVNNPTTLAEISGIAIDVGGTKIAVARIANGIVQERRKISTVADDTPQTLIDKLEAQVRQLNLQQYDRIAAAVSGRVDHAGNWHAVNQSTLGTITQVPLAQLLSERFSRPVPVINDAVAGAIAEHQFGAAQNTENMAYLTISTGVGAGLILNGKPLFSSRGLIGHVGFTSSAYSTRLCGSGRVGTVESIASGKAIVSLAEEAGYAADTIAVFEAFRRGEPWASEIVKQSAAAIAALSADLAAILDLECIVLGGSVGLADGYCNEVNNAQRDLPPLFQVAVVASALDDSVLIGALA